MLGVLAEISIIINYRGNSTAPVYVTQNLECEGHVPQAAFLLTTATPSARPASAKSPTLQMCASRFELAQFKGADSKVAHRSQSLRLSLSTI